MTQNARATCGRIRPLTPTLCMHTPQADWAAHSAVHQAAHVHTASSPAPHRARHFKNCMLEHAVHTPLPLCSVTNVPRMQVVHSRVHKKAKCTIVRHTPFATTAQSPCMGGARTHPRLTCRQALALLLAQALLWNGLCCRYAHCTLQYASVLSHIDNSITTQSTDAAHLVRSSGCIPSLLQGDAPCRCTT
jgi:hypothetical protein